MCTILQALRRHHRRTSSDTAVLPALTVAPDLGDEAPSGLSFSALLADREGAGPLAVARGRALAHAVSRMVGDQALPGAPGTRAAAATVIRARALVFSELPLAAYWMSVAQGGRDAWDEEKTRIRRAKARQTQDMAPELRRDVSDLGAIRSLLPLYRSWGQVLLEADAMPDIRQMADEARAAWEAL
jgi:hypothetical protein